MKIQSYITVIGDSLEEAREMAYNHIQDSKLIYKESEKQIITKSGDEYDLFITSSFLIDSIRGYRIHKLLATQSLEKHILNKIEDLMQKN